MKNKVLLFLVAGIFGFTCLVLGQVAVRTGSIYGKVVDDQGQPLPGVTINLESETIPSQTVSTGPGGGFRFPALPPGVYILTFSVEGYTELSQENVRVSTGGQVQLDIKMSPKLGEEFTVIAETPVVDSRKTGVDQLFTREYLEDVPTARDPWVIIDQTSGLDTDRYNVAGSESGQQSAFIARGGSDANTVWNLDGVNTTDVVATGGSPDYYDFDSFQELQITTAGNDVSIPTGGVAINIVTKRGGNRWEGDASYFYSGESLQADNLSDEAIEQGVFGSNKLDEVKDYGFNAGGPIIKDKLFVFGAYRKNEVGFFNVSNQLDFTELENITLKVNVNETQSHESQFMYFDNDKIKSGRVGFRPGIQDTETLWDQGGETDIRGGDWFFQHSWIPNDHTFVTGRYGFVGNGFSLTPPAGKDVPIIYLANAPRLESTFLTVAPIDRPAHNFNVDLSYYKEEFAGGDHEFKFGFEYKSVDQISSVYYGNGQFIIDLGQTTPGGPLTNGIFNLFLPINGRVEFNRSSFYAQDTFRRGRLTMNLGFRFDRNWSLNEPTDRPTLPGFEDILPPIEFAGNDPDVVFNDFSPRVGFTWDFKNDGKTIVRANYARYYDIYNPYLPYHTNPAFSGAGAQFAYVNLNGDRSITPDEVTALRGYFGALSGPNFDLADFLSRRPYADDLSNSYADEFLVGFERELIEDLSFAATLSYRSYGNPYTLLPANSTAADWQLGEPLVFDDTVLGSFNIPFYEFVGMDDGVLIWKNLDGVDQTYTGLDLVIKKRMSNNFLLNGSLVLQRTKLNLDGADAAGFTLSESLLGTPFPFDPGHTAFLNGQPYAFSPGGSGKAHIYPYSEWQVKVSGVYQFPWNITAGAFARYQQGYPFVLLVVVEDESLLSTLGTSTRQILAEPFGDRRYDNIFTLDLNVQKRFELGQYATLTLAADIFNLFNDNTVVRREHTVDSDSLNNILETISPRALRLGVRFSF